MLFALPFLRRLVAVSLIALAPAPLTVASAAEPVALRVVPASLDLGLAAPEGERRGSVWLINATEEPVHVSEARRSCGCFTLTFAPTTLGAHQALEVPVVMKAPKVAGRHVEKSLRFFAGEQLVAEARVELETVRPEVDAVLRYLEARAADPASAAVYLAPGSRLWFGRKEGPGVARDSDGSGPWSAWDRELHATSRHAAPEWMGDAVRIRTTETNDYHRLLGIEPRPYHLTFYVDAALQIEGMLVSAIPGTEGTDDAREQFEAWAREQHPDAAEQLMPGGQLTPSLENAILCRALLREWRAATGREEVALEGR